MNPYIQLLRPPQWIKNVFVFAALVFGAKRGDPAAAGHAFLAFAVFCLASSAGYAFNDVLDRERDQHHPVKRERPVARGAVSVPAAILLSLLCGLAAVSVAFLWLPKLFLVTVLAYWLATMTYSVWLKHLLILDVVTIAMLFVVRALAGAVAVEVRISPWLMVCTFMLCLFLGFGKRRSEIAAIHDADTAGTHRATLRGYNLELLNHLLSSSGGMAIISFLLYTMDTGTPSDFPKQYLLYTIPLVVYCIWRYASLITTGERMGPTDIIISDRPFQLAVVLWCVLAGILVAWGDRIGEWVAWSRHH